MNAAPLTQSQYVLKSFRHHWRMNATVAFAVAAATAVITGALLVGDSMRGSLQTLTLQRLGNIDYVLYPARFFRQSLADSLATDDPAVERCVGLIYFSASAVETVDQPGSQGDPDQPGKQDQPGDQNHQSDPDQPGKHGIRRAGNIQVFATDDDFWSLQTGGAAPAVMPRGDQVVLNTAAANELQVAVGDRVTIRLPVMQAVPADSPLGHKEGETEGLPRLQVVAIVADDGLARLSLMPSQQQPMSVFLPLELVQSVLDRPGQVNMLLIDAAGKAPVRLDAARQQAQQFADAIDWTLADFGLTLEHVTQSFPQSDKNGRASESANENENEDANESDGVGKGQRVLDYYSLTSDQLLLPDALARAIHQSRPDAQSVMTYLANAIDRLDDAGNSVASVPYSIITAIDSSASMPLDYSLPDEPGATKSSADGKSDSDDKSDADDKSDDDSPVPIVINQWTAERLGASPGDTLRIFYYEPETRAGKEIERHFDAVLTSIVPITQPATKYRRGREPRFEQRPTVYNDPHLTPSVPGVTDQDSMDDWDLPFKLERPRSKEDDLYWDYYRLTPKAFVPLADGQRRFGSRFGNQSSLKFVVPAANDADLTGQCLKAAREVSSQLGFAVQPIRAAQLRASAGTTPFDVLFISLSFFVIVAALMLVALLFRLAMEQRASQYGIQFAIGFPPELVSRLALREGMWVSFAGAVIGVLGGLGYGWIVLHGLRTWWVGAVTVPFLRFHASPISLAIGLFVGSAMAGLTIWWTARRLRNERVSVLIGGRLESSQPVSDASGTGGARASSALGKTVRRFNSGVAAAICLALAVGTGLLAPWLQGQAQAGAFVGSGMLLLSSLVLYVFHRLMQPRRASGASISDYSLKRMAVQNARRNPLRSTLSIGLLAVAVFLIVSMGAFQMTPSEQGVGGMELIARSASPVYRDLGQRQVQADMLGPDAASLADAQVFGFRWRSGQDASCNNLYQAAQPQVLGVCDQFIERFNDAKLQPRFAWVGAQDANPWDRLSAPATGTQDDPIAVVLDLNTAMYALQMYGGVGSVKSFTYPGQGEVYFKVVGLLDNSVLQGSLLIGEANFKTAFPQISGYQYFMIDGAPERLNAISGVLEDRLSDWGMDVSDSREQLAKLLAVQNTYLRTFQSLGAVGLLLGTFGLATVQLRSVWERTRELALMRAAGFSTGRLAKMVLIEHSVLLVGGIGCGLAASFAALVPYMIVGRARIYLGEPLVMLIVVFLVGLSASVIAIRRVVMLPLLPSLRSD